MHIIKMIAATAVSLALAIPAAIAQQSDLVGKWTAKTTIILELEGEIVEAPRTLSIVIDSVNGSLVRGSSHWKADSDDAGYIENLVVHEASEPIIGSISADGKTLRLVEVDDNGFIFVTRLGDDEIDVAYMESTPHAVAYSAVFRRQE